MEEALIDGLYFRVHRPEQPPSTSNHLPVLLLHGWLGTSSSLSPLARALASRGHTVLAADLPYHGRSHLCAAGSPRAAATLLASATSSLLVRLGCGPAAAVVGYSLGGRLALELAGLVDCAVDVRALVLVSSGLPAGAESLVASSRRAESLRGVAGRGGLRTWLRESWYSAGLWGGLVEADGFEALLDERLLSLVPLDGDVDRLEAAAVACEKLSPGAMTPDISLPGSLPVLFVYGERDEKYCGVAKNFQARYTEQVHAVCVPDAGHNVLMQNLADASPVIAMFVSPVACGVPLRVCLANLHVQTYSIKLKKEMRVGQETVRCRVGALFVLVGKAGVCGVGDIAPLPGLHPATFADCSREALEWYQKRVRSGRASCSVDDVIGSFPLTFQGLSPAAESGVSAALIQCLAAANRMSPVEFLCAATKKFKVLPKAISYNGVAPRPALGAQNQSASSAVNSSGLAASKSGVLKLKVGFNSIDEDVNVINLLLQDSEYCRNFTLRLDANCSWSTAQFERFCDLTKVWWDRIEYIEEPFLVESPEEFKRFCASHFGISRQQPKVGLDESLSQFALEATLPMLSTIGVAAIVLKPSVQGSIPRMLSLARKAELCGVKIILSSVFDSGVGLAWAAVLSAAIGHPAGVAHGVGTFQYLDEDSVTPGFEDSCVSTETLKIDVPKCESFLRRVATQLV